MSHRRPTLESLAVKQLKTFTYLQTRLAGAFRTEVAYLMSNVFCMSHCILSRIYVQLNFQRNSVKENVSLMRTPFSSLVRLITPLCWTLCVKHLQLKSRKYFPPVFFLRCHKFMKANLIKWTSNLKYHLVVSLTVSMGSIFGSCRQFCSCQCYNMKYYMRLGVQLLCKLCLEVFCIANSKENQFLFPWCTSCHWSNHVCWMPYIIQMSKSPNIKSLIVSIIYKTSRLDTARWKENVFKQNKTIEAYVDVHSVSVAG